MTSDESFLIRRAEGRIGAVLRGKWRIDRLLGVGGMAAVYEGTHRNGKRGAVKILHLELSVDAQARTRFLQEGYVANKVNHPGAVSVLDDDVAEDGSVFLVMEQLEGETLDALATRRPGQRLGVAESLRLIDQLLDVIAAAHDQGIVHRDIKPENLFISPEGRLKVLDFGLARMRELQGNARITKTGNAMGTPAFLPPEQALGHWDQVGPRTDLWAVGATLFTLLTGCLVHQADTLNKLLLAAMTKPAPPVRTLRPDLPRPVAALIDRALAFEARDRWADARTMQRALREALSAVKDEEPAPPPSAGAPAPERPHGAGASLLASALSHDDIRFAPRRSLARIALAGVAAAAVAAVLIAVAVRGDASPSPSAASAPQTAADPLASLPIAPPGPPPQSPPPVEAVAPPLEAPPPLPSSSVNAAPVAASARVKPPRPAKSADPFDQFR